MERSLISYIKCLISILQIIFMLHDIICWSFFFYIYTSKIQGTVEIQLLKHLVLFTSTLVSIPLTIKIRYIGCFYIHSELV